MLDAADLFDHSVSKVLLRLMISHIIHYKSAAPRSMINFDSSPDHSEPATEPNSATFVPMKTTDADDSRFRNRAPAGHSHE